LAAVAGSSDQQQLQQGLEPMVNLHQLSLFLLAQIYGREAHRCVTLACKLACMDALVQVAPALPLCCISTQPWLPDPQASSVILWPRGANLALQFCPTQSFHVDVCVSFVYSCCTHSQDGLQQTLLLAVPPCQEQCCIDASTDVLLLYASTAQICHKIELLDGCCHHLQATRELL
jgi:hypothetical protein